MLNMNKVLSYSYSIGSGVVNGIITRIELHDINTILILFFKNVEEMNICLDEFRKQEYVVQHEFNTILNPLTVNDNGFNL